MSRLFTRKAVVAIAFLGIVAAACAQEADTNPLVLAGGDPDDIIDDQPTAPEDGTQLIDAALRDVETYWTEMYPEVYGGEWQTLQGGFVPYGPDTNPLPCEAGSYEEIAQNAFYCREPYDLIAWDEVNLVPPLAEDFGGFTVAAVFAHEFGHAVQGRSGFQDETLWMEQQADCFAGAWVAWIAEGNSDDFAISEDTLDFTIAGFISFSDAAGSSAADPMAHGSGFDRVGAFQEGYANGAQGCLRYESPDERPDPTEIPFLTENEMATGGNLATDQLLPLVEDNLNVFYGLLFEELGASEWEDVTLQAVDPASDEVECGGDTISGEDLQYASLYCEDERTVVMSTDLIMEGYGDLESLEEIGDFAIGAEIGRLYARAAQLQLGVEGDDEQTSRLADCMTGYWSQQIFPMNENAETALGQASDEEGAELVLSAGDLDEAIMAFLTYGRALDEADTTAFERFAALRLGFDGSIDDCQEAYGSLGG